MKTLVTVVLILAALGVYVRATRPAYEVTIWLSSTTDIEEVAIDWAELGSTGAALASVGSHLGHDYIQIEVDNDQLRTVVYCQLAAVLLWLLLKLFLFRRSANTPPATGGDVA